MTGLTRQLRLPAALFCLLTLVLFWELLAASPPPPPLGWSNRAAVTAPDDGAAEAGTWMGLILARPLFRTDRRPLAAVAQANADMTLPRLTAIVITAAGRNAIFIGADGSASVLAVGGHTGPFEVQDIASDSVRVTGPTGLVTIHPQFAGATTSGATTGIGTAAPAPPNRTASRREDK
jgi:hypothetical protein